MQNICKTSFKCLRSWTTRIASNRRQNNGVSKRVISGIKNAIPKHGSGCERKSTPEGDLCVPLVAKRGSHHIPLQMAADLELPNVENVSARTTSRHLNESVLYARNHFQCIPINHAMLEKFTFKELQAISYLKILAGVRNSSPQ